MELIHEYLYLLIDVLLVQWFGWVPFLWLLVYMLFWLRRNKNQGEFVSEVKWIFLEVRIEELNERSAFAMEQVFAALHAIHGTITWGEAFAGKVQLWMSCEIVSLGGKVSYIYKIPEKFRNLLESAIFAQYPKAEIYEVEDYLKNLPHHYEPEHVDFDFWGTQLVKKKDNAFPIKTYVGFEHKEQDTFIDPLANVLEAMSNIQPYELMAFQIVIKPVDDKWKEHAQHLVDKLKGVPEHHVSSWFDTIFLEFPGKILDGLMAILVPPGEDHGKSSHKEEAPSQMQHKSEGEKMVIAAVEKALSKIYYEAKVRILYLAPKDKFNKGLRIPEIIGAVRNFDDVSINGLKPDTGHTWTDATFKISKKLEAPYIEQNILLRKRHLLHQFMSRSAWMGVGKTLLNTEELATIYHFPQSPNVRVSQIQKVQTVKSAPPPDLPIG